MTTAKDELLAWLRDAHAMETQAETMLKGQAGRLEHYPKMKARVEQHLDETREQARLVAGCLDRLGESESAIKDIGGSAMAMGQSFAAMMSDDEVLKGVMASYAFEHFEIAAYRMLIAAAQAAGEMEIKQVCERILPQEEAMAAWIEANMMDTTMLYLSRVESSQADTAKR